jgi:hypothetical protein
MNWSEMSAWVSLSNECFQQRGQWVGTVLNSLWHHMPASWQQGCQSICFVDMYLCQYYFLFIVAAQVMQLSFWAPLLAVCSTIAFKEVKARRRKRGAIWQNNWSNRALLMHEEGELFWWVFWESSANCQWFIQFTTNFADGKNQQSKIDKR